MIKKFKIALTLILTLSFIISIQSAIAESTASQQVYVSTSQLNFVGEQNVHSLDRTIIVAVITNESVSVNITPTDLYDNASGKVVQANLIEINPSPSFSLSAPEKKVIDFSINSEQIDPGTYQGDFILTSSNSTTTSILNIQVTVKIQPEHFSLLLPLLGAIMIILIAFSVACGQIETLQQRYSRFLVLIFGFAAIGIWLYLILSSVLPDPGNIIATALIAPFIAYLIYYVKDLRDESKSLQNNSLTIRNKGVDEDFEALVGLTSELTAHYASFTSMLHDDGLISAKGWEKARKQGKVSDFPLLRLERYYGFVTVYNKYYAYALKVSKQKKRIGQIPFGTIFFSQWFSMWYNKFNFTSFEDFRKKYAELEKILFVNLEYNLGELAILSLSPLKTEYPRITRSLLYTLVDSGVLSVPIPEKKDTKQQKSPEELKADYKEAIGKWNVSSKDFKRICREIYNEESIQTFLRFVDSRFEEKYSELKGIIENLSPLPEDTSEEKKEPLIKGSFAIDKSEDKRIMK